MAFESIGIKPAKASAGARPWLEDALEQEIVEPGSIHEVVQVKESRKKSGYTLRCGLFQVYAFKSEEEFCETLILTLDDMCAMQFSFPLLVEIDPSYPLGINLGIDKDVTRVWQKKEKFGNIILFQSTHQPTNTSTDTLIPGTQKKRGRSLLA